MKSSSKGRGPIVWVPQNTGGRNLHAATTFGALRTFTYVELPTDPEGVRVWSEILEGWMADFDPDRDYILLIGDPVLIAKVSALTARHFASYNVLKWDRQMQVYIPIKL